MNAALIAAMRFMQTSTQRNIDKARELQKERLKDRTCPINNNPCPYKDKCVSTDLCRHSDD